MAIYSSATSIFKSQYSELDKLLGLNNWGGELLWEDFEIAMYQVRCEPVPVELLQRREQRRLESKKQYQPYQVLSEKGLP